MQRGVRFWCEICLLHNIAMCDDRAYAGFLNLVLQHSDRCRYVIKQGVCVHEHSLSLSAS